MSTEMNVVNVIDMPVEQVTEAIVAAAKRVRKPKAEITIVEQIINDILAGKFAEEAASHLKQIFGDDFCIKRGLMEKPKKVRKPKAPKVSTEAPPVSEPKEKKVRKPKAPKVSTEAPPVSEPKEKKVRKPKAPKVSTDALVSETPVEALVSETPVEALVSETPVEAPVSEPKEKKARKPKAPTVSTDAPPVSETPVEVLVSEPKEKKARKPKAPKAVEVSAAPVETPVETPETPVETPPATEDKKVKKVRKPKSPKEESSDDEKKVKKVRKATAVVPNEVPVASETIVEAPSTPAMNTDEFSENWGRPLEDELVEEELSDIEEEA